MIWIKQAGRTVNSHIFLDSEFLLLCHKQSELILWYSPYFPLFQREIILSSQYHGKEKFLVHQELSFWSSNPFKHFSILTWENVMWLESFPLPAPLSIEELDPPNQTVFLFIVTTVNVMWLGSFHLVPQGAPLSEEKLDPPQSNSFLLCRD